MSNTPKTSSHLLWRQNVGYVSALVGFFGFVLGSLWLVQKFLTPRSPSTFGLQTCIIMMGAGIVLCLFGVVLVWPKEAEGK